MWSKILTIMLGILLFGAHGCSVRSIPWATESCNIRAYIDLGLLDYVSRRYHRDQPVRYALIPFVTPENFASTGVLPGTISNDLPQDIVRRFQAELARTSELGIVEVFDPGIWQGKKEEFFKGNYQALTLAKNAGYDFAVVGQMEPSLYTETFTLNTKIIDLSNHVTVWYARTDVTTNTKDWQKGLGAVLPVKSRHDLLYTRERLDEFARCTADYIVTSPGQDMRNKEQSFIDSLFD